MENNNRQGCRWTLEDLVVYDQINGDFVEVENLEYALKYIKDVATDPEEGIHPDIESIRIYKEVANVVCEQVEGKETYKVKVVPIPESIEPCATSSEKNIVMKNYVLGFAFNDN